MANVLVISILVLLVIIAIYYIVKNRKQGNSCIGCPSNGVCNKKNCTKDL